MVIQKLTISFLLATFLGGVSIAQNVNEEEFDLKSQPTYYSLNKALRNKESAYKLDLSNTGLKKFPLKILELKELRHLFLDSNLITTIPEGIDSLKKLKVFSLYNNKIQSIPASISNLSELRYLYLNSNEIKELPNDFFLFNELWGLYINDNNLTEFPTRFKQLQDLYILNISDNDLKVIPDEIGHMYSLETLGLQNTGLQELPERISELKALRALYVNQNQLGQLPRGISELSKLKILNIDGNKITELPSTFSRLHKLEQLYMSKNLMTDFPQNSRTLVNLQIMAIEDNPITSLPNDMIDMPSLEKLYLEGNQIEGFPQVLYDLQNKGVKIYGIKKEELFKVKLLMSQGRNNSRIGEYDTAISKYEQLLKLDTNNVQAMTELANVYLQNGDFEMAFELCNKALSKNTNENRAIEIIRIRDASDSKTNKTVELINKSEAEFEKDKTNVEPLFELGKSFYEAKRFDLAKERFQKALTYNPNHAYSQFYLSLVSLSLNESTPFIFSCLRYLTLEEKGSKAATITPHLYSKMGMKTGVKNKKGAIVYYVNFLVFDDNGDLLYKSESPQTDIFSSMILDLFSAQVVAQGDDVSDKEAEELTNLLNNAVREIRNDLNTFKTKYEMVLAKDSTCDTIISPFNMNYYYPYFVELKEQGHLDVLANLVCNIKRTSDNLEVKTQTNEYQDWLDNNSEKVEAFRKWSNEYKWPQEIMPDEIKKPSQ